LELAQDRRLLSPAEQALRKKLKLKALALASLQHAIVRQRARILHLSARDANTKFFHSHTHPTGAISASSLRYPTAAERCILRMKRQPWRMNFFNNIIGTVKPRQHGLDFDFLDLPSVALDDLATPFMVEEIEKNRERRLTRHLGRAVSPASS
jgi:hypothetical protein